MNTMADEESVEREAAGSFSKVQLEVIVRVAQRLLDKSFSEWGSGRSSGSASDEHGTANKSIKAIPS